MSECCLRGHFRCHENKAPNEGGVLEGTEFYIQVDSWASVSLFRLQDIIADYIPAFSYDLLESGKPLCIY